MSHLFLGILLLILLMDGFFRQVPDLFLDDYVWPKQNHWDLRLYGVYRFVFGFVTVSDNRNL